MSKGKAPQGANRGLLVALLLITLGGVGGLAAYVQLSPAQFLADSEKKLERRAKHPESQSSTKVPVPKMGPNNRLWFEHSSAPVAKGEDPMLVSVNEFLKSFGDGLHAETIRLDGGVAMIDFPAGTEFAFGSQDEATFLLGLRSAMGQFSEVREVELYLGGQKLDELGHEDVSLPMPVIRPSNWKSPLGSSSAPGPSARN